MPSYPTSVEAEFHWFDHQGDPQITPLEIHGRLDPGAWPDENGQSCAPIFVATHITDIHTGQPLPMTGPLARFADTLTEDWSDPRMDRMLRPFEPREKRGMAWR
ncbi:hypothetical protein [Granulibacter bethesdensis]|uniref:hypothetical protein n=1 Tax=Granulibacter bethesdensis TaxID=364410 RepID=UPI00046D3D2A|nr:hypothetical protein [Granulibacter bethesdensis]